MRIHPKIAIAFLAAILAAPLVFAQDPAPAAPPFAPDQQAAPPHGPNAHYMIWRDRGDQQEQREHSFGMHREGFGKHGGEMGQHLFMLSRLVENPEFRERLGITPEQAAKIHEQLFDLRKEMIRAKADLEIKHLELREMLLADAPDRAAIDKKLEEISAARLAQQKSAVDHFLAVRDTLTAEQRQKLRDMREHFRQHEMGPGHGGPHPEGMGHHGPGGNAPPPGDDD